MDEMVEIYNIIKGLGKKYNCDKIILFGSRARGDHSERSDVDLAIYNMPEENRTEFWMDMEDLPTLLKFDIVHVMDNTSYEFVESIEKEGEILYEKD